MRMTNAPTPPSDPPQGAQADTPIKALSPAAQRALAEAAARRVVSDKDAKPIERDGPSGVEPTRFGDWERKGIAYDF
jgi:hypothetical protein